MQMQQRVGNMNRFDRDPQGLSQRLTRGIVSLVSRGVTAQDELLQDQAGVQANASKQHSSEGHQQEEN
jgi:hypothetical protein